MAESSFFTKPVQITLTAPQANYLWTIMKNIIDCTDNAGVSQDSRRIVAKLEKAARHDGDNRA